jgi:hypothetical protein
MEIVPRFPQPLVFVSHSCSDRCFSSSDAMRRLIPRRDSARVQRGWHTSQYLLAAGLVGLVVGAYFPAAPVLTAMALVTLGATVITVDRFAGRPPAGLTFAGHAFVYGSLYFLFVGAVLPSAAFARGSVLSIGLWLDLAASIGLMAISARRLLAAFLKHERGEDATTL